MRLPKYEPRYKLIRNEKSFDQKSFVKDVKCLPFSVVYGVSDPDEKLSIFNNLLLDVINKHAPIWRIKATRPPASWMNDPANKKLQNSRDISRFEAHQSQNPSIWDKFKETKREIKKAVRRAKSTFNRKTLSKNNPKEVWKIIHGILHPPVKRVKFNPVELNKYFATIASVTLKKEAIPRNETCQFINSLPETQKDDNSDFFHLHRTSYQNVLKAIKTVSTGPDEIPIRFVKVVDEVLCYPLTYIINAFITYSKFPTLWKVARIVPMNKVATPTEQSHFRPIAILPARSKIFERTVCNQLIEFIDKRQLYKNTVTGFRKGFSTVSALLKLRDDIKKAMSAVNYR